MPSELVQTELDIYQVLSAISQRQSDTNRALQAAYAFPPHGAEQKFRQSFVQQVLTKLLVEPLRWLVDLAL